MNTRRGKANFNNFRILLGSGCISTILMQRLMKKPETEKDYVMQWHTQAVNITNNLKVRIYSTLPEFSVTKIVTWGFHVDDSTKSRYDMILGRYILIAL